MPCGSIVAREAAIALDALAAFGLLEYGEPGSDEEFFLLKLKDRFARSAIDGYRSAIWNLNREERASLLDYLDDLQAIEERAAAHSSRKIPD